MWSLFQIASTPGALRLACFYFSPFISEAVSGSEVQTGCRLDGDLNCHCESDKVLICPPGSERLDITRDKCAVERKWQDAGGDKMPSATVVGFFPPTPSSAVITADQQLIKMN